MQYEIDSLNIQRKKLIDALESKVDSRKIITAKVEVDTYISFIQIGYHILFSIVYVGRLC